MRQESLLGTMSDRKRARKGSDSVSQRPDGLWVARGEAGYETNAEGKRIRKRRVFYGRTKAEALAKLRDLRAVQGGTLRPRAVGSFGAYFDAWFEKRRAELSLTTHALWESLWRLHASPELGDVPLAAIDVQRVENFVAELRTKGCGVATIRNVLKMLGASMSDADQNPFAIFARRQRKKQAHGAREIVSATPTAKGAVIASEAAARRFVEAARKDRYFALWVLLAGTGLRLGEALGLEWRSVDLRRGTVEITQTLVEVNGARSISPRPKTEQSERIIAIGPTIVAALKLHRASDATSARFVFTTENGEHPSRSNLRKRHFIPVRDAAELGDVSIKNLRHSHASLLDAAGVAIATVSKRLGHADPAMTLRVYRKRVAGEDRAAADTWERIVGVSKKPRTRK